MCRIGRPHIFQSRRLERKLFRTCLRYLDTAREIATSSAIIPGLVIRNHLRRQCRLATASAIDRGCSYPTFVIFVPMLLIPRRQVRRSTVFVVAKPVPLAAAPYRASGLVRWPDCDMPAGPAPVRSSGWTGLMANLTSGPGVLFCCDASSRKWHDACAVRTMMGHGVTDHNRVRCRQLKGRCVSAHTRHRARLEKTHAKIAQGRSL